jgi:hypothetical protein
MASVAKRNKYGQVIVVAEETAHLPHVEAIWYDGGIWASGHAAVLPGETPEQAGKRAFGRCVPGRYANTLVIRLDELV